MNNQTDLSLFLSTLILDLMTLGGALGFLALALAALLFLS